MTSWYGSSSVSLTDIQRQLTQLSCHTVRNMIVANDMAPSPIQSPDTSPHYASAIRHPSGLGNSSNTYVPPPPPPLPSQQLSHLLHSGGPSSSTFATPALPNASPAGAGGLGGIPHLSALSSLSSDSFYRSAVAGLPLSLGQFRSTDFTTTVRCSCRSHKR